MFDLPYEQKLANGRNILIAGAGGGFDIFSGLPLYFALRKQGKNVHLANFSFTELGFMQGELLTPTMMKVLPSSYGLPGLYFPEWYLCQWLHDQFQEEVPIYAFAKSGVQPLLANYRKLVDELEIDTIVLADGGTDSLMRGDEDGLGTPAEDLTSLAAVSLLNGPQKLLVCLGFGVDHYHGVSNDLTLAAIAELTQGHDFLGSLSLLEQMPEVQMYRAASQFVFEQMPNDVSIVNSSILSAVAGHYGNHHATERTKGSKLWINPLMPIYWFFDLPAIAKRNLILSNLYITDHFMQVVRNIQIFRRLYVSEIRKRSRMPD